MYNFPSFALLLCLNLLLSKTVFSSPTDLTQPQTIRYQFEIENEASLDLEELSDLHLPFKAQISSDSVCKVLPPSLYEDERIPYRGLAGPYQLPFLFENTMFVFELMLGKSEPYINICEIAPLTTAENDEYIKVKMKRVYSNYAVKSHNIQQMKVYEDTVIFSTDSELLFFEFKKSLVPEFKYGLALEDNVIRDFEVSETNVLYIVKHSSLFLYNTTDVSSSSIMKIGELTTYKISPEAPSFDITNLRAVAICQNIVFLAEGSHILIFENTPNLATMSSIPIIKSINMASIILQMKKVGRSLVVLTTLGVTEYIFVNDCLDIIPNFVMSFTDLGFNAPISMLDSADYVELRGCSECSYFLILNKMRDTFYIFESGTIQGALPTPYMYSYSDTVNEITSVSIQETFDVDQQRELVAHVRGKDSQLFMIRLRKKSAQMLCSSWLPRIETCSIAMQSRFCNLDMYNYTAVSLGSGNIEVPNNPNHLCTASLQIELTFKWPGILTIVIIVLVAAIVVFTGVVIYLRCKSKRSKLSQTKQKHIIFNGEDRPEETPSEDINGLFTFNTPKSADTSSKSPSQSFHRQWRSFAEKKGLRVTVPRQLME